MLVTGRGARWYLLIPFNRERAKGTEMLNKMSQGPPPEQSRIRPENVSRPLRPTRWADGVKQNKRKKRTIWTGKGCVGVSLTHPCFLLKDGSLWLFSSRATQVTFRLGLPWSQGPAGWRARSGQGCFSRGAAGFTHRLQLPLLGRFTQATSGWPLSHCLLREAPGGN